MISALRFLAISIIQLRSADAPQATGSTTSNREFADYLFLTSVDDTFYGAFAGFGNGDAGDRSILLLRHRPWGSRAWFAGAAGHGAVRPRLFRAAALALIAERDELLRRVERMRQIIRQFQRAQFGRHSERLDPDQLQLLLEENAN